MKREIFRDIMSNPLKIQYDMQCKRVLKNKIILAWILKYAVREFSKLTLDEIVACIEAEPEIGAAKLNAVRADMGVQEEERITGIETEDSVPDEGSISYDIRFFARYPLGRQRVKIIINIAEYSIKKHDIIPGMPDKPKEYDKISVVMVCLNDKEGAEYKTKIFIRNLLDRGMSDADICALAECESELIEEVRKSAVAIHD